MEQDLSEKGILGQEIDFGGPFDDCRTRKDTIKRVNEFLLKTGLHDESRYIRIGAFLARCPFGREQVKCVKKEREREGTLPNQKPEELRENSRSRQTELESMQHDTKENLVRRQDYEDKHLEREGDRGRWQIYRRQNWHVHALVLCCSLGAAIQGWDETAVNGGKSSLPWPWPLLISNPAQLTYKTQFKIERRPGLVGLVNSAPYLMCIVSCLYVLSVNLCKSESCNKMQKDDLEFLSFF